MRASPKARWAGLLQLSLGGIASMYIGRLESSIASEDVVKKKKAKEEKTKKVLVTSERLRGTEHRYLKRRRQERSDRSTPCLHGHRHLLLPLLYSRTTPSYPHRTSFHLTPTIKHPFYTLQYILDRKLLA
jgi:hypothetical protein